MMNFTMYSGFSKMVAAQGVEKAAEYAASLGFSSVEILERADKGYTPVISTPEEAEAARKILERYGLTVACYSVFANLWHNEGAEKSLIEQTKIAAALGSPYLHHTILPWLAVPESIPGFRDAVNEVLPSVVRIAQAAAEAGVVCLYEEQGFFINGVEGYGAFYREMKKHCQNIGVCGDLGNILFVNENPEDLFREYIGEIRHVHVKDYLRTRSVESPGKGWMRAKDNVWLLDTWVGKGVVNVEACMNLLKSVGYEGKFAMELCFTEGYEEAVPQAMELLEKMWTGYDAGSLTGDGE